MLPVIIKFKFSNKYMSEKYKAKNTEGFYFITLTIIDWIDLLVRPIYKHILIDSLQYCQINKGLNIYAYVIMPSHIHLIVKANGDNKLQDIVRDFKRFTSIKLIETIKEYPESRREWLLKKFEYAAKRIRRNNQYKIWQDGYHPLELTDNKMIEQRLNYIHNNPVVEEVVINPEDYKYSSARNYCGDNSVLSIERL